MKYSTCILIVLFYLCEFGSNCERNGVEYHLGTKSGYRFVANKNSSKIEFDGCVPQKIWMLTRHGTRNPSAELIDKFSSRLPEIRDLILEQNSNTNENLFKSLLQEFRKWRLDISISDEKKLTLEGKHEMVDLAERMQSRFPTILPEVYSNSSFKFRFTRTQRTKKSAQYFSIGLFGKKTAKDVWFPDPIKSDPILRFYKQCARWKAEVKKNPKTLEQRNKFIKDPIVQETIKKVNNRLNLNDALAFEDLHLIYAACAFETAWNKKRKSPWCSVFDEDTIKVMEYAEDLKYYWVDGYGYELTYKQACPAFNDMIQFLENKDDYPTAALYFTHSGTLLKMLGHLGLYHDNAPLLHTEYDKNLNRKFVVSKIDPFANNLAFVSFKCGDTQKLLVLHQESAVKLPSCPESELCDLATVKQFYRESIQCDFQKMCHV